MRRGKRRKSEGADQPQWREAESKSYYEEQENALNDLSGLLKTF